MNIINKTNYTTELRKQIRKYISSKMNTRDIIIQAHVATTIEMAMVKNNIALKNVCEYLDSIFKSNVIDEICLSIAPKSIEHKINFKKYYNMPQRNANNKNYHICEERLASFKNCHHIDTNILELCKAGFYYMGTSDAVKCYSCGLELSEWTRDDCPIKEHFKHRPKCKYVMHTYLPNETK